MKTENPSSDLSRRQLTVRFFAWPIGVILGLSVAIMIILRLGLTYAYIDLGGKYALSFVDPPEYNITYCTGSTFEPCKSGIPVVPLTVTHYDHDRKWIIARSEEDIRTSAAPKATYWIVRKLPLRPEIARDDLHTAVQSQTYGPFDSLEFEQKKADFGIKLHLSPHGLKL